MIDAQREGEKPRLRRLIAPLFFAASLVYLAFHALSGERGLYALFKEQHRLEALSAELEQVSKERAAMEHRVRLMSAASLDLDLLDEQARLMLGYGAKNEVVVLLK